MMKFGLESLTMIIEALAQQNYRKLKNAYKPYSFA